MNGKGLSSRHRPDSFGPFAEDPPSAAPLEMFRAERDVAPPRARSIDDASDRVSVRSGSWALLVAVAVVFSFAGFGGGFLVGQRSSPASDAMDVSGNGPVADPQLTRAVVDDPRPVVSAPEPAAPIPTPVAPPAAPRQQSVTVSEKAPTRTVDVEPRPASVPARNSVATNSPGSLHVISRPSGAQVFVDDNLIGTTPFLLSNVSVGLRSLRIELSGYKSWTTLVRVEPGARYRVSASLEP